MIFKNCIFIALLFISTSGISQDLPEVRLNLPEISSQEDKLITGNDWVGFGILAFASFTDGVVEGYEFDSRRSFERKWDVDPEGFFGSQSWRRAYKNGNPEDGYKSFYTKHFGAWDFYHVGDDLRKIGYITGSGFTFSTAIKRKKGYIWRILAVAGITSAFKAAGMAWVRN